MRQIGVFKPQRQLREALLEWAARAAVNMGAGLAFLSFFTALARSFDVITDPLMGWISASTTSRFGISGRRKPYIF
jgi:hypothetical protein